MKQRVEPIEELVLFLVLVETHVGSHHFHGQPLTLSQSRFKAALLIR